MTNSEPTVAKLLPLSFQYLRFGGKSAQELYRERSKALRCAPALDEVLREHLKRLGKEPPENKNLALVAIEEFRTLAKQAQSLRRALRVVNDPAERKLLLEQLANCRAKLAEYKELGLSFEYAYRVYLQSMRRFHQFYGALREVKALRRELLRSGLKSVDPNKVVSEADLKGGLKREAGGEAHNGVLKNGELWGWISDSDLWRVEQILRQYEDRGDSGITEELEVLACVYPPGSPEFKEVCAQLVAEGGGESGQRQGPAAAPAKTELVKRLRQAEAGVKELWKDPMVRYFWGRRENERMLSDIAAGKDVLESEQVIGYLNRLRQFEENHPNTTVGGVLVGPPGVGKTTLVRHYLECTGRRYVYIDLSEDVSRYLIFGSKEIRFTNNSDYLKRLCLEIEGMVDTELEKFIRDNAACLKQTAGLAEDEALVVLLAKLQEDIERGGRVDLELARRTGARVKDFAKRAYHRELAGEFYHLVHRNGWRDGVVIAALRRGDCIIFDEFPHFKQWHMLNSLMTTKPGALWYFADNNEWIKVPENWRMYFTGNIGTRHGGFVIAEKMASRVGAQILVVTYPPKHIELTMALALICDPDGNLLRDKDDQAKLFVLVNDAFPKIRALTEKERHTVPVSYRTLQALAEKLIRRRDPETGWPVYQPRDNVSFDEALWQVMIDCYALYEDKKIPGKIVDILTSVGLLLDDSVKERVLCFLDSQAYEERRRQFESMKPDFNKVVEVLCGFADGRTSASDRLAMV